MMKKFLISMLGALAGFWISMIVAGIAFFVVLMAIIAGSAESVSTEIKDNTILHIKLSGQIDERKSTLDITSGIYGDETTSSGLNNIIQSIKSAADDKHIKGIYLDCEGSMAGIATRNAIVGALKEFKKSGKWIISYSDIYTQGDYFIACTADSIYLNPVGSVDVHGLSSTTLFFKDMLDRLGVEAQVLKVGTFKSAVEPYILTEMSEANRMQQQLYLGNIWKNLSSQISEMRNVPEDTVNEWADNIIVTENQAFYVENKVVDHLCYRHQVEDKLKELSEIEQDEDLRLVTPDEYCVIDNANKFNISDNQIAVLYAVGDITDNGKDGIVGRDMAPLIMELSEDEDIKGLVLRVNSGGGSAFASEQIWEALENFKAAGKKFYVSMGDVAASGGYYISCGADKIYAEPVTITGSIGIFGIIPCAKDFLNKNLGITSGSVMTNANGNFPSLIEPMTDVQRMKMQANVNRGYELFVSRCATGRNMPVDSIKQIAEGRVWDGVTAMNIGLVDKLGGLQQAIDDMVSELNLEDYTITEYPSLELKWWNEILNLSKNYKASIIENELGTAKPIYDAVNRIQNLEPIQCRMEEIIIE